MFYGVEDFPFLKVLEESFSAIRDEALSLEPHELLPYPVKEFYNRGWWVCPLRSQDSPPEMQPIIKKNRKRCPRTWEALQALPGNHLAGFSILEPGCEMEPHVHDEGFFIAHLGLVIPPGCGIEVLGQARTWEEGRCFAFHETDRHYAWNRGSERRIVFLGDFQAPRPA